MEDSPCSPRNACACTQASISAGTANTVHFFAPRWALRTGKLNSDSHRCTVRIPFPTYREMSFHDDRTAAGGETSLPSWARSAFFPVMNQLYDPRHLLPSGSSRGELADLTPDANSQMLFICSIAIITASRVPFLGERGSPLLGFQNELWNVLAENLFTYINVAIRLLLCCG